MRIPYAEGGARGRDAAVSTVQLSGGSGALGWLQLGMNSKAAVLPGVAQAHQQSVHPGLTSFVGLGRHYLCSAFAGSVVESLAPFRKAESKLSASDG